MTMEEVKTKLHEGEYRTNCTPKIRQFPKDHIFDETKSIVWNREEVARRNEEFLKEQERVQRKCVMFEEELIAALQNDYGFSKARAVLIHCEAYDQGHSEGYYEVINKAENLADFAEKILAAD